MSLAPRCRCARLMNFPDTPPPAALRLVPEVAAAYPRVSSDGKTYTFTLRSGFRFSDGTPVQRKRVRTCDQAYSHQGDRLAVRAVRAGHRRRRCRSGGAERDGCGCRRDRNRLIVRFTRTASTSSSRRRRRSSAPFRRRFRATPRASPPSRARARTTSRSIVRGSASCWNGIAFTAVARPHHVDRYVVDLQAQDAAGGTRADRPSRRPTRLREPARPSTSTPRRGWSESTESTSRSSSSSRGSSCGATT